MTASKADRLNTTHHRSDAAQLKIRVVLMQLIEIPLVLEQQDRAIPGITHRFAIEDAPHLLELTPTAGNPASHLESQRFQARFDPILVFETVLNHLQLQLSNRRKNRITLAFIRVIQDLNRTFLAQFVDPLRKFLNAEGFGLRNQLKISGLKQGIPSYSTFGPT